MRRLRLLGPFLATVLLVAACSRQSPLEDIVDAPTDAPPGVTLAQVTSAAFLPIIFIGLLVRHMPATAGEPVST